MPRLVRVEVDVQPDCEDAERDDATVEVAAHFFEARAACSSASDVCRRCAPLGQDLVCSGI